MSKAVTAAANKTRSPTGWWLMKSEPDTFSIDQLAEVTANKSGKGRGMEEWSGVRNYQARNFIRSMQTGDRFFFYHSNTATPAVVGVAEVVSMPYPDPTQFDKTSKYYDADSKKDDPRWTVVDVKLLKKFKKIVSLEDLKKKLTGDDCAVAAKGNRLSVMPVLTQHAVTTILSLAGESPSVFAAAASAETKAAAKKKPTRRERDESDDSE